MDTPVRPPMRPLHGIMLKLGSVLIFIVMQAMIKSVSHSIPPGESVFFRSFFAIPVIVVWLAMRHEMRTGLQTKDPFGHFWRGLMGTLAMGLGFAGLAYLPLPEVTAISYAAPLLVVILAAMFLGEEVRGFRIAAVALGLVGVLIVLSPRLSTVAGGDATYREAFGASLVLASALCSALAMVFVRKLVQTEKTPAIVFWFCVTSTLISFATIPFGWVMPTPWEAMILVTAGLMGGVGQILLTSSYRHADASVIAPFEYASMIFSLLIGFFIFSEVPTLTMLGGAALVVAAGILIIWRERRLGLERAQQRKSMPPHG